MMLGWQGKPSICIAVLFHMVVKPATQVQSPVLNLSLITSNVWTYCVSEKEQEEQGSSGR